MKTKILSIAACAIAAIFTSGCTSEKGVQITDLSLDKNSVELRVNETSQLLAIVTPSEAAQNASVAWDSENPEIASVSDEGLVTAVAVGETAITATLGDFIARCDVSVVDVAVESVQLNKISISLIKGESETLEATVSPEDADNVSITWTSSDEAIATVTDEGTVTAIYPGNAVISATAGGITATCDVEVLPQEVESVTLDRTEAEIFKDETIQLVAQVHPDGTGASVEWSTDNFYIAEVSEDGVVLGKEPGQAVITATANGKSATCNITVLPVEARSISLDPSEITLSQGETVTITATVEPENYDGKIEWTSDDTDVAVVNLAGEVTAVGDGHTTITAAIGDVTATCSVTVSSGSSDINIGDYYYSDGTWSQELDPSKTPIGVIFYLCDPTDTDPTLAREHPECTHGYVVALQKAVTSVPFMENYDAYVEETQSGNFANWLLSNAPEYESVLMGDENRDRLGIAQGYNNTEALKFFNNAYPTYQTIAKYAVAYEETCAAPDGTSGWYIPSPKETSLLFVGEWDGDLMAIDVMFMTNYRDMINSKISKIEGATLLNTGDVSYWTSSCAGVPTAFTQSAAFGWVSLQNINANGIVRCILAF